MTLSFKKISWIMSVITSVFTVISLSILFLYKLKIYNYYLATNKSLLSQTGIYNISINIYIFFITIVFTLIGFSINKISKYCKKILCRVHNNESI